MNEDLEFMSSPKWLLILTNMIATNKVIFILLLIFIFVDYKISLFMSIIFLSSYNESKKYIDDLFNRRK